MNFLILGDGAEELAWARHIIGSTEHRLAAAFPGFEALSDVPTPLDLDDALAMASVEAAVVGGPPDFRAEALRRVAAEGLPAICLHPPGPDADPYYQVALSHAETGAILVPDLPTRLHPGVEALREALQDGRLGAFRVLQLESSAGLASDDLARLNFPRIVDVVRSLIGEVEAVTATGDPPGEHPRDDLLVQLRGPQSRRAEIRITTGPPSLARLVASGSDGSITLDYDPAPPASATARLVRRTAAGAEEARELPPWDPRSAILSTLIDAIAGLDVRPNLLDGTRAMELAEAVVRSLRRGRTIDLHYEEISEAGTFKSIMTSVGCAILLGTLIALPAALVGPAFGLTWTLYLAYAIPPLLILFILLQALRFAARSPAVPTSKGKQSSVPTGPRP